AAGERSRRSAEGEVVEPDVAQEGESLDHLLQDRARDLGIHRTGLVATGGNRGEVLDRLVDRQLDHVTDAAPRDQYRQGLGTQALAVTRRTRHLDHVSLEVGAHCIARRLPPAPRDIGQYSLPLPLDLATAATLCGPGDLATRQAVEQRIARLRRDLRPRRVERELEEPRQRGEHDLADVAARLTPGQDHALE